MATLAFLQLRYVGHTVPVQRSLARVEETVPLLNNITTRDAKRQALLRNRASVRLALTMTAALSASRDNLHHRVQDGWQFLSPQHIRRSCSYTLRTTHSSFILTNSLVARHIIDNKDKNKELHQHITSQQTTEGSP